MRSFALLPVLALLATVTAAPAPQDSAPDAATDAPTDASPMAPTGPATNASPPAATNSGPATSSPPTAATNMPPSLTSAVVPNSTGTEAGSAIQSGTSTVTFSTPPVPSVNSTLSVRPTTTTAILPPPPPPPTTALTLTTIQPPPPPSSSAAPPAASGVQLHPNGNTAKCLDVKNGELRNGAYVQIYDCEATHKQRWILKKGSTKVQVAGTNFCLDAGGNPASGTKMKIWECYDGLPAQQWWYTDDNRIALEGKGLCLDLTDGVLYNNKRTQVWACIDGNTNQVWTE